MRKKQNKYSCVALKEGRDYSAVPAHISSKQNPAELTVGGSNSNKQIYIL